MHQASKLSVFAVTGLLVLSSPAYSWSDRGHLAVAKAAGYDEWYNAVAADILVVRLGRTERRNHDAAIERQKPITEALVLEQAEKMKNHSNEGRVYGAIIASIEEYERGYRNKDVDRDYYLALAVHYIGDLSAPLHNIAYDGFNAAHHAANDALLDRELKDDSCVVKTGRIGEKMYEITIAPERWKADLAKEVARIAVLSRQLGLTLEAENRDMTKEEAYVQAGHSASLLRAIVRWKEQFDK